jgi:hypothetical protein
MTEYMPVAGLDQQQAKKQRRAARTSHQLGRLTFGFWNLKFNMTI